MNKSLHKILFLIHIAFFQFKNLHAQQLFSSPVIEQPDGITIEYFNSKQLRKWKTIFIGDSIQVLYPNAYYDKALKTNISNNRNEIVRIREIVNNEFIKTIEACCEQKKCPDTNDGFWIRLKTGTKYEDVCIDKRFTSNELCGSDLLYEVLLIFEKLAR